MAKHAHKLILVQKKTWKCLIPGCSFFVHLGLAHVLIGKQAVCSGCGDEFTVDERALEHEMPKCFNCRLGAVNSTLDWIQTKEALAKAGVKSIDELPPAKVKSMQNLGILPATIDQVIDEIEVIEPTEDE